MSVVIFVYMYIIRLGFFYCPYLPLITIVTLVIHFYVRRVREMANSSLAIMCCACLYTIVQYEVQLCT